MNNRFTINEKSTTSGQAREASLRKKHWNLESSLEAFKSRLSSKFRFFAIFYCIFLFVGMFSCDDDCGPFSDPEQRATQIRGSFVNYEEMGENLTITPLSGEMVPFDMLAFQVNAEFESVDNVQVSSNTRSWSLFEKAYACSPRPPFTAEKIVGLEILANKDFKDNFPAGSDLSSFFDLVEYDAFSGLLTSRTEALSFFEAKPKIPLQMTLVLKEAPQTEEALIFTVKLYLESEIIEFYEFESNSIVVNSNN